MWIESIDVFCIQVCMHYIQFLPAILNLYDDYTKYTGHNYNIIHTCVYIYRTITFLQHPQTCQNKSVFLFVSFRKEKRYPIRVTHGVRTPPTHRHMPPARNALRRPIQIRPGKYNEVTPCLCENSLKIIPGTIRD